MRNPQAFDYNRPDRNSLAGIYVEVSDSDNPANELRLPRGEMALPAEAERLFGVTLTVADERKSERPSQRALAE